MTAPLAPSPISFWQTIGAQWMTAALPWANPAWQDSPLARLFPIDPKEVCRALIDLSEAMTSQPALLEKQLGLLTMDQLRLGLWAFRQLGGEASTPPVETPPRDRRFDDEDWVGLLPFSVLRQSYLIWSKWLIDSVAQVDEPERQRVGFYLRQWAEALSPANFPITNPQVLRETIAQGGENLQRGLANLLADAKRGTISLSPPDIYRPGENLALTPGQVVFRNELMELIQYAPRKRRVHGVPLLVLPPWINRYYVLDMRPGMSMVEYLVEQGHTVFMVSWRNPSPEQAGIRLEDYLRLGALEAMKVARSITGSRKVNLVGYCIGGTLLGLLLAYLAAKRDHSAASATFFTSLLDFSDVGETAVFVTDEKLAEVQERMKAKGFLSPEELSTVFRLMRGNDLIWSFAVNNYLLGRKPPAFDLMHWSVDGTRLPRAMQEYYVYHMYAKNHLRIPGRLEMLGTPLDLGQVSCPTYVVAGGDDHIVPWKSAFASAQLLSGPRRFVLGKAGHITAVVSPAGSKRARYQVGDMAGGSDAQHWLNDASSVEGSWWADWMQWLKPLAGERKSPPPLGTKKYPAIEPAPGQYVLER